MILFNFQCTFFFYWKKTNRISHNALWRRMRLCAWANGLTSRCMRQASTMCGRASLPRRRARSARQSTQRSASTVRFSSTVKFNVNANIIKFYFFARFCVARQSGCVGYDRSQWRNNFERRKWRTHWAPLLPKRKCFYRKCGKRNKRIFSATGGHGRRLTRSVRNATQPTLIMVYWCCCRFERLIRIEINYFCRKISEGFSCLDWYRASILDTNA